MHTESHDTAIERTRGSTQRLTGAHAGAAVPGTVLIADRPWTAASRQPAAGSVHEIL